MPPLSLDDPIPPGATGIVMIDLAAIAGNWRALRDFVAPAECAAVVKADAYGLGAARVIPALTEAGCRTFFVATASEAEEARALAPAARIFVLDGLIGAGGIGATVSAAPTARRLADTGAIPVVVARDALAFWNEEASRIGRRLRVGVQVETGLNRLGWRIPHRPFNPRDFEHLDLALVMSHLACADELEHPMNARQLATFNAIRDRLKAQDAADDYSSLGPTGSRERLHTALGSGGVFSLAASDGIMLGPDYHFDLVRPGYALYGGQASMGRHSPVKPVVSVHARVVQVTILSGGETVGYGAAYTQPPVQQVFATIAAGYADGLPRAASGDQGGGFVAIDGVRCPIVGRVSMDLTTVALGPALDANKRMVNAGDLVEIIGPTIPLEAAGSAADTIGYELLTRLGRRFHRRYVE